MISVSANFVISIFRCAGAKFKLAPFKTNVWKIIDLIRQNDVSITCFVIDM